jgi:hypothetical protein
MTYHAMKKKRGRKILDPIDAGIKIARKRLRRGARFLIDTDNRCISEISVDNLVRNALFRETNIVKYKENVEFREIPVSDDIETLGGCPVATRLSIPHTSIAKCLNNSFDQICFRERVIESARRSAFFTPEAHILLSKASEQFVLELSVRAFFHALCIGHPHLISSSDLVHSVRTAWRSGESFSSRGSLDFLNDTIDRSIQTFPDILDVIRRIHIHR